MPVLMEITHEALVRLKENARELGRQEERAAIVMNMCELAKSFERMAKDEGDVYVSKILAHLAEFYVDGRHHGEHRKDPT